MNQERLDFTADKDVADAVRIEASADDPKTAKALRKITRLIAETFLDEYSQFVPEEIKELLTGIEDRVLVVDELEVFAESWTGEKVRELPDQILGFQGCYFKLGRLSVVKSYREMMSKKLRRKILRRPYRKKKRLLLAAAIFLPILTEEILHQFESKSSLRSSPWLHPFSQCGTIYYRRKVLDKLGLPYRPTVFTDTQNNLYERSISLYGDDVHRVFFGSREVAATQGVRILERFGAEVEKRRRELE